MRSLCRCTRPLSPWSPMIAEYVPPWLRVDIFPFSLLVCPFPLVVDSVTPRSCCCCCCCACPMRMPQQRDAEYCHLCWPHKPWRLLCQCSEAPPVESTRAGPGPAKESDFDDGI
ncbi:uncharacterized protein K452DRAFT_156454 [Aplosporella prunicola CBS 121167]|uniref:Uncharacterized protein n=1 Tax=Aplosporella prunicola CBS 121167 TaxID=1176127 RepID=A0A6A6BJJ6_9PEZI|nr:uncharacterized protein K452DRAFT_156454 [Aplosporella prunicola CBS 121167]KAF2144292.1 hypothetical protein K452DRAFT_156454 [Aplosporella prunicola CBS 121167]